MGMMTDPGRGGAISRLMPRSFSASGLFLRKRLWIWPLVAAAVLGAGGFWLRETIEGVMEDQLAANLQAVLNGDLEAIRLMFRAHEALTSIAAADPEVRTLALEVASKTEGHGAPALLRSPRLDPLRALLRPWMDRYEYDGFVLFNPQGVIVAATRDAMVGTRFPAADGEFVATALAGKPTVSRTLPSVTMLTDVDGKERVGVPTMFVVAPVRADDGKVAAVLGFRLRPERSFTRILNIARFGKTGETYAFDRSGRLLSESRFDDELKRVGLIADQSFVRSTLNLELRDPQVDMTRGARPKHRRGDQPLTRMAEQAVQGHTGMDVNGHRDYRGVPVVGAWTWLPEYGFGVATQVDRDEAYRPLTILRTAFAAVYVMLALAAVAIFAFSVLLERMRRSMREATLAAKQLGRYTLDEKIGEGGMGMVYRARHAMLRRPTAVKLLSLDKISDATIARFEREVQLTSRLNHPNTITIYDYGRTTEGIFYYAMEYLDGIDLQALIQRHGAQPEGRVIRILAQVCGSLAEAHGIGLIHRDIKPANVILNRRGGVCDFVKLLDFGLAKALDAQRQAALTTTGSITGTPLYMAPENIADPEKVDARSDLYSVAAVGYALLTGGPVFDVQSVSEILYKQVHILPEAPSARLGRPVSPDLESLLLRCLAKDPKDRPADATELRRALAACVSAGTWTDDDAEAWWRAHPFEGPASAASAPQTLSPISTTNYETTLQAPGR